jgi:hypothetical protein
MDIMMPAGDHDLGDILGDSRRSDPLPWVCQESLFSLKLIPSVSHGLP